jgi:hypothetical protein
MDFGQEFVEDTGNITVMKGPPICKNTVLDTVGETGVERKDMGIFYAMGLGLEWWRTRAIIPSGRTRRSLRTSCWYGG